MKVRQTKPDLHNESQIVAKSSKVILISGGFAFLKNDLIMPANIITTEDLQEFKIELINDIRELLSNSNCVTEKKWMKSSEIKKVMGISTGTLQNLRNNGTLPYTKVGGIIFYDSQEIQKVMNNNRVHHKTE